MKSLFAIYLYNFAILDNDFQQILIRGYFMKRVHSGDSVLVPYSARNPADQRQVTSSQASGPNYFQDMPMDIICRIFACLPVNKYYEMNLVCRQWHNVLTSEAFGSVLLIRDGVTKKADITCLKTYHLWMKNETYIMLDCSNSMDTNGFSSKALTLVQEIAEKVFQNQWIHGVNLGIFSGSYRYEPFYTNEELAKYLADLDVYLRKYRIDTSKTKVVPLLDRFYKFIDMPEGTRYSPKPDAFMHLISDCGFNEPWNVNNWVLRKREARLAKPIIFNVHWLKNEKSELNSFITNVTAWEAEQKPTDKFQIHMHQIPIKTETKNT
jgi:hypothetical protein